MKKQLIKRIDFRIPAKLKSRMERIARTEQRSLNSTLIVAVEEYLSKWRAKYVEWTVFEDQDQNKIKD